MLFTQKAVNMEDYFQLNTSHRDSPCLCGVFQRFPTFIFIVLLNKDILNKDNNNNLRHNILNKDNNCI